MDPIASNMTGKGTRPALANVVKAAHTAIFVVELVSICWLVVSGVIGRRDRAVVLAATAVTVEAAVFIGNRGVCPLTPLAERLGASDGTVSDIFLPRAVARTIPIWSTALIVVAGLLHLREARRTGLIRRFRRA